MHDNEDKLNNVPAELTAALEAQVMRLLPRYIKTLELHENSLILVNAWRINLTGLIQALQDYALEHPECQNIRVLGCRGTPEFVTATRAELVNYIRIIDGESV